MVTKLAVSNIAWRPDEAEAVLDQLHASGVRGLEIAPGLAFPGETDPFSPSAEAIDRWYVGLDRRAMKLVSMQSLLFGRTNASLFGSRDQREVFTAGVEAAIDLAQRLSCPVLVLGSPTARSIPDGMDHATAHEIAREVIGGLGDRCKTVGASLALEPNPAAYGTNFLNTFRQTANFVRALGHCAVRVNLDLGALIMNAETDAALGSLPDTVNLIGHVHISEPHLGPAPADETALSRVLEALNRAGYPGWVSIEMRGETGDNLGRILDCVSKAQSAIRRSEDAVK